MTTDTTTLSCTAPHRTRIKICGLTRPEDVQAACAAGADAVGFVCYPKSPRFVSLPQLAALASHLPPFVTPVLLFVNSDPSDVMAALDVVPNALLQFHGDESKADCERFDRPYIRAGRVQTGFHLPSFALEFANASALLLDTYTPAFGGSGETFDWQLIAPHLAQEAAQPVTKALVFSGGLSAANVTRCVSQIRPWAVDVSSGVEAEDASGKPQKGIKDAHKIQAFIHAVRCADATASASPPPL